MGILARGQQWRRPDEWPKTGKHESSRRPARTEPPRSIDSARGGPADRDYRSGWMALNAVGSTAIWRSTSVACTTLTVLMLSMALAWRLVAQCREILDELVLGLERVSMGDLSH